MSTCRDEILAAAEHLAARSPDGTFTIADIVRAMTQQGTRYQVSTIRTHVASRLCVDAPDHHAGVYPDLERVGEHRYRLRSPIHRESQPTTSAAPEHATATVSPMVEEESLRELPAGDSSVQRRAETIALAQLSQQLGIQLEPKRLHLPGGDYVDVDGVSHQPPVLVEVWAHQGPPKPAQRNKVLADALKLSYAAELFGGSARRVLCFTDREAAEPFRGRSWYAGALRHQRIEVEVVALPDEWRQRIREAQARQYR